MGLRVNRDDLDQQAAAQARVGTMLRGKWRLEQLLGVGGMAAVYAATHRNASRGAVKMLHPYLSQNTDIRRRFLQEGYAANKVNHPGTVRCLDDDEAEDGAAFVVMELLEGESLEYRRAHAGGSLPVEEVLALADQLLDVLAAAHEAGIIHRDIKPENLFLTHEGQLKVLDFGIARIRGEGAQSTAPGAAMGTPAFMSPEQARGESERIGPATDLWAVGATLHNLLTGTYAHDAATLPELLAALCSREPPALTARWPDAPPSVTRLVGGALRLDPAQRWPGARQMQAVAREAYQEITGGPLSSAARPLPIAFDKTHLSDPPPRAPVTRPEGLTTGAIAASSTRSPASPSVGRRGGLLATGLLVVAGGAGWMLRPAPSPIPPANTASAVPPPTALPSSSGSLASTAQAPHRTTLRIRSASPCVVFVDGTDMGETPQEIGVSPGRHEVRCGTESQSAEVGDGETLVLSFRGETKPSPTSVVPPSTSPKPASPTKPPPASKGPDLLDRRED